MFVGIGAQKTGTTWLADYLAYHDQVCFSPIKELHYFDTKYFDKSFQKLFIRRLHKLVSRIKKLFIEDRLQKNKKAIYRLW